MSQIHQPLHPNVVSRLDPEYIAFHSEVLAYIPPQHTIPWDPTFRHAPAVPGCSDPLEVGSTRDYSLEHCKVRVFTPIGSAPAAGWPGFLYFHGGGWTLGSLDSENSFATNMCMRANCVVVSVDYGLAPEQPYPKAVDDAMESLLWLYTEGKQKLGIDLSNIAVGGSSSGGNLAAIVALKAAQADPPIPLVFQLLIVPVTDNTADLSGSPHYSWKENEDTPWLSPARMMWFRRNYLPNESDWDKWDASPIFASDDLLSKTPRCWIAVNELDILRDEGIAYGNKLSALGVPVDIKVYPHSPHPIMAMDKVLRVGAQLVTDAATVLKVAFN